MSQEKAESPKNHRARLEDELNDVRAKRRELRAVHITPVSTRPTSNLEQHEVASIYRESVMRDLRLLDQQEARLLFVRGHMPSETVADYFKGIEMSLPNVKEESLLASWARTKGERHQIVVSSFGFTTTRVDRLSVALSLLEKTPMPEGVREGVLAVIDQSRSEITSLMREGGVLTTDGRIFKGDLGVQASKSEHVAALQRGRAIQTHRSSIRSADAELAELPAATRVVVLPQGFHREFLGLQARDNQQETYRVPRMFFGGVEAYIDGIYASTEVEGFTGPLYPVIPTHTIAGGILNEVASPHLPRQR